MASEKAACAEDTGMSRNQAICTAREHKSEEGASSSNLGKVLVKRALFGSRRRPVWRQKSSNEAVKLLPSRLSKVSLAEDHKTEPCLNASYVQTSSGNREGLKPWHI
ncbi:uncharacterized protein LOC125313617 [Rhodamnia argentea]|uniref:Uncharacterized protein LOC125313617 n=1 Tax=Rhodamnia argentea TaxID=178133 RepID=A0ABM3GY78_9MYRT|nr:uncharacterized protein LOC125313617 [Rhodamnia argentea]